MKSEEPSPKKHRPSHTSLHCTCDFRELVYSRSLTSGLMLNFKSNQVKSHRKRLYLCNSLQTVEGQEVSLANWNKGRAILYLLYWPWATKVHWGVGLLHSYNHQVRWTVKYLMTSSFFAREAKYNSLTTSLHFLKNLVCQPNVPRWLCPLRNSLWLLLPDNGRVDHTETAWSA